MQKKSAFSFLNPKIVFSALILGNWENLPSELKSPLPGAQGWCLYLMILTPRGWPDGGQACDGDPGNRCQWCLVSQEVIWCCLLALMSGKMCGRHLGGIFLCAHERIPRGLGRFSFSKAWRTVSGGEARKLLRSALPTNIRFNGRCHFGAQEVVKSTERNI